ncbi:MAG: alpha-isopropylmalate synthase regulatory domain-containing protein [Nanoarchaeota archaeon]
MENQIEIYDCTLREGEQAEGARFNLNSRIRLCEELDNFGVDYIELGWPIASQEIFDSFKPALENVKKAKIVAFGSTSIRNNPDEDENLNSIVNVKVRYACIFGKSSMIHVKKQLGLTEEENLDKIFNSIKFLRKRGIAVFYDAEHYFDAFKENKEYSIRTLIKALEAGAERIILCDTNGGILPYEAGKIVKETKELLNKQGFDAKLGVHFHNDCGLALANTLACLPYINQVQGTINGIGERIGNLNFSEFLPVYVNKIGRGLKIDLRNLKKLNENAFRFAGLNVPERRAFVGDLAFAHKGGVHIDATNKGASYEHANPEDFGNKRTILLNTLGGRSSIVHIAEQFGYNLDKNNPDTKERIRRLFEELRRHEINGYRLGAIKAEQFLLIEKYFGENNLDFKIKEWNINSEFKNSVEKSSFYVSCSLNNEIIEEETSVEGGPVDAAFKTLKKILMRKYPEIEKLNIMDFHVSIALQHGEESAVRTKIDFLDTKNKRFSVSPNTKKDEVFADGEEFSTIGVDRNIIGSAVEALAKGFRYYLIRNKL